MLIHTPGLAAGISASRILHLQGNNKSGIRNLQMVLPIEINVDCKLRHGSGIDEKCYWVIYSPIVDVPGDTLASQFCFISGRK